MGRALLEILVPKFPNEPSVAPFARKMDIHSISVFVVSNTSIMFELRF